MGVDTSIMERDQFVVAGENMANVNDAAVVSREVASRGFRTVAVVVDVVVALCALDLLRVVLLEQVPIGQVNIWLGSFGLAAIIYLVVLRGRVLPSPGYYALNLKRVHFAEYQEYANGGAEVYRNFDLIHTSVMRALVVALSAGVVVAWALLP
jgi:hypothetical protein